MEESNKNNDDPIKRFVEKDDDSGEMSPFNPPDAYSTSSVEPVAYDDMAPVLQKLMNEHKKFIGVLERFENALVEWKKNNWTISDDMNSSFKEFFQFVYAHSGYEMCASMLTWNLRFGIAKGIKTLLKGN